jgi:hypothetical protein
VQQIGLIVFAGQGPAAGQSLVEIERCEPRDVLHGFVDLQPLRFILMKIGAARRNIQIRNSRSRPAKSANRRPGFCAQEMKQAPTGLSRYAELSGFAAAAE